MNGINSKYRMPEEMWERIQPLLPKFPKTYYAGRPRVPWRPVLDGIFYVLRTGCQWKAIPPEFASSSTCHRYFQFLVRKNVFWRLWSIALTEYDEIKGVDWSTQTIDGSMVKAPLGGDKTGPNPTDRAKRGVKRSLATDGAGIPIGLAVAAANVHDQRLVRETLESLPISAPSTDEIAQHIYLDKGYDAEAVRALLLLFQLIPHIPRRGSQPSDNGKRKHKPRRWVVERTISWINRFRRLLIRWEKKPVNYSNFIYLAFAYICYHAVGILG